MYNVLYVPDLDLNLFSVRSETDSTHIIHFSHRNQPGQLLIKTVLSWYCIQWPFRFFGFTMILNTYAYFMLVLEQRITTLLGATDPMHMLTSMSHVTPPK